jgi:hypothetical protein
LLAPSKNKRPVCQARENVVVFNSERSLTEFTLSIPEGFEMTRRLGCLSFRADARNLSLLV